MRPRRLALAALAVLALAAAGPPEGWQRAVPEGGRLTVEAEPVALSGGTLTGLTRDGAWVLRSTHPDFGGLSGLVVAEGRLTAVSDKGWWFGAALDESADGLRLAEARFAPMRDPGGDTYTKAGGDAEGLTRLGPRLAVSFERDHRVMFLREMGRFGATVHARAFEQLRSNKGLEALATLPDGRLIVLAEGADDAGVPVFVIDPGGAVTESRLPRLSHHSVTGADMGPDGRLYVVLRHFSFLAGVSVRVVRYGLGADGLPDPARVETLANFEQHDGVDNMEGIAVEEDPGGGLRLWLIADDNFNPLQRTLLLRFAVTG